MSILLQTGVAYPDSSSSKDMGAGSEPDTMEAPVAPEDSHQPPPVVSTYHHCFGLPYQDHNYGAPPPPTPPQSPPKINGSVDEDTTSTVLSTTSTAEENEQTEESITRCICEFDHDDEYMICCDKCQVWQHVDCMGIDRNNIPDTYMCEKCQPRKVDRQKAVALQTKKKEEMSDSSSDESGDENATYTTVSSTPTSVTLASSKSKIIRNKRRIIDNQTHKRTKKCKNKIKDKEDSVISRQSKKKVKIKEEFTPLNEDTRDSWETALILFSEKYEEAFVNQYSIEVQQALGTQKLNGHCDDTAKLLEQLQVQLCKIISLKHRKALIAAENIFKNQFIVEYRGKLMLQSHFEAQNPFFKRFDPFVLFYTKFNNIDMCIDSREYGNIARFVRRSCSPNSEVRHIVENGSIHLCIYSTEEIKCDDEITIPFDFNYEKCDYFVECACTASECDVEKATKCHKNIEMGPVAKRRRPKKANSCVDADSNQSSGAAGSASTNKCRKLSPLRLSLNQNQQISDPIEKCQENHIEEQESEEILAEKRKKMTREERKMEAIMKAFAKMERTEKRRQQALERLANTKLQQQQTQSPPDQLITPTQLLPVDPQPVPQQQAQLVSESRTSISETSSEESKPNTPLVAIRNTKGKKGSRKSQNSASRWRCRANSGSSDALSPDENSVSMPSTPLTAHLSTDSSLASTPSSANTNCAFKFPKTKKILMNEWLNEKAHNVSKPLLIKTESLDVSTATPTCYVKSARSPLALTHLRRISTSGQGKQSNQTSLGSAKKRWLRQAMCETGSNSAEQNSPLANGCPSPIPGSNSNSPSISPPADLLTPLKKRRLMRESLSDGTGDTPPPSSTPDTIGLELTDDLCEKDDSLDEHSLPKNGIKLHFSAISNIVDENSSDEQVWSTTQNDMNFVNEVESKSSQVNVSNNSKDSSSLQVSSSTEKSDDSFELVNDLPVKEDNLDKNSDLPAQESQKEPFIDVGESEQTLLDENESYTVLETVDSVKSLAESTSNSLDIKETTSPDSSCNNSSNNVSSNKNLSDAADICVHKTDIEIVSASSSSDNIKNCANESHVLQSSQETELDNIENSCKSSDPTSENQESIDLCTKVTDSSHGSPSSTTPSVIESSVCNSTSDDVNKSFLFSSVVSSSSSSSSFVSCSNTFAVNTSLNSIASVNNTSAVTSSETNSTGINSCATLGHSDSRPMTSTVNTTTVSTSPAVTTTTPRTPPVKKKVSLLEYRMRKRDSITTTITPTKSIVLACLNTPPKGPATLSPLPLFEPISPAPENGPSNFKKAADNKRESRCATSSTGSVEDGEPGWSSSSYSDRGNEVRENLTQRLRREFGLIDDEKEKSSGNEDNISSRSLRTPPPPPPPNKEQCVSILPSQKSDLIGSSNHTTLQPNGKPLPLYGASPAALIHPANSNVGPRNIPTIITLQSYPPPPRLPPPLSAQQPPPQYGYQSYNQSVVHGQSLQNSAASGPVPISSHNNFRQPPPPQFSPTPRPPVLHPLPLHQQPPPSEPGQTSLPPIMPSGNYNEQCPCVPLQGYHDQSQAPPVPPMQHYYRDPNKSYNPPPPSLQPTPPRPQNHFNQGYYP